LYFHTDISFISFRSTVDIANSYGLGGQGFEIWDGQQKFLHNHQTVSAPHPASYPTST